MNLLLLFSQFALLFAVFQSANFPTGRIPTICGLEEYLPHMAKVLDRQYPVNLSYPSIRIILALNKYYSAFDDNCNLFKGPLWPYYRNFGSYKYKLIADEFSMSSHTIGGDIPWYNLIWLEERINFTIKKCILMDRELTLEFLKEALIGENSLETYESFKDTYFNLFAKHQLHKEFLLQANYQALIRTTVLKELERLLKDNE